MKNPVDIDEVAEAEAVMAVLRRNGEGLAESNNILRHGRHLFNKAMELGWDAGSEEGPLEYLMRTCYQTGWDDRVAAESGSR